jgi:geranylgeranyl pyrophosphate synthase
VDIVTSLKEKILAGDAIHEAQEQAERLADLAIAQLDVLPASEAKDALVSLAHMIVERSF